MANIIVTETVNQIRFKINNSEYNAALKKIRSLKTAWTDASGAALKASKQFEQAGRTFRKSQEWTQRAYNPQERKAQAERLKQQKAELAIARRTNQIRAAGVRFNTKSNSYNLSSTQRAQAIQDFGRLTREFHAGSLASAEYSARLQQLYGRMRQQGGLVKKPLNVPVTGKVTKLDTSLLDHVGTVIGVTALFGAGASILRVGQDLDSVMSGLTAVTGSSEKASAEFEYLRSEANRLGTDLQASARDYMKWSAATKSSMSQSDMKSIFESLSEYSTVLGLSSDRASLALNALTQMSSKSIISMEELRQQFGDQIPGAISIFTAAYNKVNKTMLTEGQFTELVGNGKVLAKNVLPAVGEELRALARNGGALEKSVNSNRAAMQRLKSTWQASVNAFYSSGFGSEMTQTFNLLTTILGDNKGAFETLGNVAGGVLDGITTAIETVYNSFVLLKAMLQAHFPVLTKMFDGMGKTVGQIAGYALFTGAIWKLGGALKFLVGFANPLKGLLTTLTAINALGGIGGMTTPGTDNKKTKDKNTKPTKGGKSGFTIGLPAIMAFMSVNSRFDEIQADPEAFKREVEANNSRPTVWTDIMNAFRERSVQAQQNNPGGPDWLTKPTDKTGWSPSFAQPQVTTPLPTGPTPATLPAWAMQPLKGEAEITIKPIEINVNDGAVKGLVTQAIDEYNMQQVNLMMGVPE
ncbi:tape measure protein [Citrobacter amalonaticus]|uniref:tape measure protein n=1 Tax=Citrobacter amalonaticus TaxID=35703 RepID=UPI0027F43872|nr:tape measure protein [Citrobacter amalonaticus]